MKKSTKDFDVTHDRFLRCYDVIIGRYRDYVKREKIFDQKVLQALDDIHKFTSVCSILYDRIPKDTKWFNDYLRVIVYMDETGGNTYSVAKALGISRTYICNTFVKAHRRMTYCIQHSGKLEIGPMDSMDDFCSLELPSAIGNAIRKSVGVKVIKTMTPRDFVAKYTIEDVKAMNYIGVVGFRELKRKLQSMGLRLNHSKVITEATIDVHRQTIQRALNKLKTTRGVNKKTVFEMERLLEEI